MRYQLIVLAALSLEFTVAQPAHHRHHHKARRNLEDVDWVNGGIKYDVSKVDWTKVPYDADKAAPGAPAPSPSNPAESNGAAGSQSPKVINVVPIPAQSDKEKADQEL
ncbi:hypothetical protein XPA_001103 [Xanthoria parietina]